MEKQQKPKINSIVLSYLAGFFDGEGCVSIFHNKNQSSFQRNPNHSLAVSVNNTNPVVLILLKKHFGGNITLIKRKKKEWRDIFQWHLSCDKAKGFLKAIKPYVKVKEKQVDTGIRFQEIKKRKTFCGPKHPVPQKELNWRESQRRKMSQLNHQIFI